MDYEFSDDEKHDLVELIKKCRASRAMTAM
jgi:hypothetical protein